MKKFSRIKRKTDQALERIHGEHKNLHEHISRSALHRLKAKSKSRESKGGSQPLARAM